MIDYAEYQLKQVLKREARRHTPTPHDLSHFDDKLFVLAVSIPFFVYAVGVLSRRPELTEPVLGMLLLIPFLTSKLFYLLTTKQSSPEPSPISIVAVVMRLSRWAVELPR